MEQKKRREATRRAFIVGAGGVAAALAAAPRAARGQTGSGGFTPPRDGGLWVTWYDLPEAGRQEHLAWVHDRYLPALLKRPGYLWAAHYATVAGRNMTAREQSLAHVGDRAVPAGNAYVLVVGGEHSNVFGKPSPTELHKALPDADRKMLAMRIGERVNIFAEAGRVEGPEAKAYKGGMALAPCIQLGSFNIEYQNEEEVLAWYAQSRMPAMAVLPGCVRTRKLASVSGWAKEGILYEFASLEARNKYFPTFEDPHPDMKAWSTRVVKYLLHAPGSPNLAQRIWPAV